MNDADTAESMPATTVASLSQVIAPVDVVDRTKYGRNGDEELHSGDVFLVTSVLTELSEDVGPDGQMRELVAASTGVKTNRGEDIR